MQLRLRELLREIRNSYWFVPSAMVFGAVVAAVLTDRIDAYVDTSFLSKIRWLYQNQSAGARAVLSAIATSMLGVAGVTFSMTIVSVSFAASNIGPRLIGNFMRDTGNQITLGTFIATFVYCLLILRTVTDAAGESASAHVPHVSLLVALALALLCVSNLIYFIHHIPESINVARIAHLIGSDLQESMTHLFPERIGHSASRDSSTVPELGSAFRKESRVVRASRTGYLQAIDDEALLEIAKEKDLLVRIEYRPGDFTQKDSVLFYAHPSARVDDSVHTALSGCFAIGSTRTPSQNAMFLVDQLVEIMMRALSPGVNDPLTAVGCMDWLQAALTVCIHRDPPEFCRYDNDGTLRALVHPVSFERFLTAVVDQPLQYVAADRTAALRMMQLLAELMAICEDDGYTRLLLQHAARLNDASKECLPVQRDRDTLARRYEHTRRIAVDRSYAGSLRDDQEWLGGHG